MSGGEGFEAVWSNAAVAARLRAAGCVFAEDEAALLLEAAGSGSREGPDAGVLDTGALDAAALERMIAQRVEGVPLEHILGWAEFAGLRIAVDPGVFVPRRRTEFLLRHAVEAVRQRSEARAQAQAQGNGGDGAGVVVLDLCCGSGALGAAVSVAVPEAEVYAADIDPAAVRSARRNIRHPERVFEGDLYGALPAELRGRIDVIVVNAPYVPTEAIAMMPPEARVHEARVALDGGADGLDVQRRVAEEARGWLAPTGTLLIETSEVQAPATAAVFAAAGMHPLVERSEELDGTVVIGTRD